MRLPFKLFYDSLKIWDGKKFLALSSQILIEALFLLKPTRGGNIQGSSLRTYRFLFLQPIDSFSSINSTRPLSIPKQNNSVLFVPYILKVIIILKHTNGLNKFFHRITLQQQKYYLPGMFKPQSPYDRVKLLILGSMQIISSVFMILHQTSTSSYNITEIV